MVGKEEGPWEGDSGHPGVLVLKIQSLPKPVPQTCHSIKPQGGNQQERTEAQVPGEGLLHLHVGHTVLGFSVPLSSPPENRKVGRMVFY